MIKTKHWSPYISGIIIGLLQIPVFLILNASIGTSGALGSIACVILGSGGDSGCFPLLKNWWQLAFVIGIMLGVFLSSYMSKSTVEKISPIWPKILRTQKFWPRAIMAFFGGFIFILGARIADGCTSGNGISGIALLYPGSVIVITSMFISGFIMAQLYTKI